MSADPSMMGPRTAVRLPVIAAVVTVFTAVVAGLVPALVSYSGQQQEASVGAQAAVKAAADDARDRIREFLSDRTTGVGCLASNTHFDEEVTKALAPPELPRLPEKAGETEEEAAARAEKAAEAAVKAARDAIQKRLKAFCEGQTGCKRVVISSKTNNILFSTADGDAGGSLGGSLVTNALDSGQPVTLVAKGLSEQFGASGVVAARMPSKEYVLLTAYETTELFGGLEELGQGLGKGGRVLVTDGRRLALTGGLEGFESKSLEIEPVTRALKGESAEATTADERDRVILAAFRPVAEAGMAVVVARQVSEIGGGTAAFPLGSLLGALVVGLLAAVLVFILLRRAFEPLNVLHESVMRVAAGDLSERVPVLSDDEVGAISKVWNEVVSQLQKARVAAGFDVGAPPDDGAHGTGGFPPTGQ